MLVFSCIGCLRFYRVLFGKQKNLRDHALIAVLFFPNEMGICACGSALGLSKPCVGLCLVDSLCLVISKGLLPCYRAPKGDHHRVWQEFGTITQRAVGSPCRSFVSIQGVKSYPKA